MAVNMKQARRDHRKQFLEPIMGKRMVVEDTGEKNKNGNPIKKMVERDVRVGWSRSRDYIPFREFARGVYTPQESTGKLTAILESEILKDLAD